MISYLRSVLMMVVAVTVAVALSTLPIRAADDSKDLQKRIKKLEKTVAALEAKLEHVQVSDDPINGLAGPHVIFDGCNVHIRSGSGDSVDSTVDLSTLATIPDTEPLGLGNLIVGYNEAPAVGEPNRDGSHNLIVGPGHNYSSVGGAVFGQGNSATGPLASVTGGYNNNATGYTASVSGGTGNAATNYYASVSGGATNSASGYYSSISGGSTNSATEAWSSVSGGASNEAEAESASVSGGYNCEARGMYSSVSGGNGRSAGPGIPNTGTYWWVAGSLTELN